MSKYRKTLYFPGGGRKELYGKTKEELEEKILKAKMQMRAGVNLSVSAVRRICADVVFIL